MWRGLMQNRALQHFLEDVRWGELDYLLDRHAPRHRRRRMGLARMLPRAEVLIVTTPARAAQQVAARAADMARKTYLRVAGVVENMSSFTCDHGDDATPCSARAAGAALAEEIGAPLLASIPLEPVRGRRRRRRRARRPRRPARRPTPSGPWPAVSWRPCRRPSDGRLHAPASSSGSRPRSARQCRAAGLESRPCAPKLVGGLVGDAERTAGRMSDARDAGPAAASSELTRGMPTTMASVRHGTVNSRWAPSKTFEWSSRL